MTSSALNELDKAAREFEVARLECDQELVARGDVDHRDRHSIGAIGSDIVDAALFVIPNAVRAAIEATSEQIERIQLGVWPSEESGESGAGVGDGAERVPAEAARKESANFKLAIKLVYFLIRSFQDATYRATFQVLEGKKPKKAKSASMMRVLGAGDPVREMLGEFMTEYEAWFLGWRAIRDRIKTGQGTGTLGAHPGSPPDDIGINLNLVTEDAGIEINLSKGTRVSDVTKAIEMSTKLVQRLTEAARSQN